MTVRLYDRDVDMLEFSAVVKTCEQREKGYIVTLDQTAFFPEGGGQGADHGTLDGVQVLDAHEVNGEVEHLVSGPLAVGSEVRGAFETVLQPLAMTPVVTEAVALGVSERTAESFLVPVSSQSHPLYNPDLDYSVYLSQPFFFILFQVIVLLVTVYAVGSEIKFRTGDDWLRTAGMNVFSAVAGKLLPYTVIFVLISVLANYVLFGVMRIPFSCGFWPLNLTSALFVVATQCLAVFLFSLFPAIGIVISVVSMVGSLGATLSGVTFPAPFMYEPVYYASFLFPVRHFVEISQNLLYGDYGFAYTWQNVAALLLFALPALLVLPRLKKAVLSRRYENIK